MRGRILKRSIASVGSEPWSPGLRTTDLTECSWMIISVYEALEITLGPATLDQSLRSHFPELRPSDFASKASTETEGGVMDEAGKMGQTEGQGTSAVGV